MFPIVKSELPQIKFKASLNEGDYWIYQIESKSVSKGSGSYEGNFISVQNSDGKVTIKKLNATMLVIEDLRKINQSSYGSGFFKQESNITLSANMTAIIDRRNLRVVRQEVSDDLLDYTQSGISQEGAQSIHFISTSLKLGQNIGYHWQGEEINCYVNEGLIKFQGSNLSVIVLHFAGPKKVTIQTISRFPEDGEAKANFNFEKTLGLLINYTAEETATFRGGACCAVTTITMENYTLQSTSLIRTKATTPATSIEYSSTHSATTIGTVSSYRSSPTQQLTRINSSGLESIVAFILIILILIGCSYLLLRRYRTNNVHSLANACNPSYVCVN
jgi:hypothetical protein